MYYDSFDGNAYRTGKRYAIMSRQGLPNVEAVDYSYKFLINFYPGEVQLKVAEWCEEHCKGDWLIGSTMSGFTDEDDAFLSKMRWT